jgi:hypothetical protein
MLPANYLLKCNRTFNSNCRIYIPVFYIDSEMYSYWILYSTVQQADESNLWLIYIWLRRWGQLADQGIGVQFPAEARFPHSIHTGSKTTQPLVQWILGTLPQGVKWTGCEADHLSPHSVKVNNGGAILPLLQMSSWLGA